MLVHDLPVCIAVLFFQNVCDLCKILPRLLKVRQHAVAVYHPGSCKRGVRDARALAGFLKIRQRARELVHAAQQGREQAVSPFLDRQLRRAS